MHYSYSKLSAKGGYTVIRKQTVLFLCIHNAGRSQTAEGLLRSLYGERFEVFSAGTEPGNLNPYAVKVMAEMDIDISTHQSKHLEQYHDKEIDYVITVCDSAKENCPYFPGGKEVLHQSFDDPSAFSGSEEEILGHVRRVRDEIKEWISKTFA